MRARSRAYSPTLGFFSRPEEWGDDGCAIIPRRIALLLLVGETTLAASARGRAMHICENLRLVATAGSFGVRQSTAAFLPTIGTSFPICTGDKAAISRRTPSAQKRRCFAQINRCGSVSRTLKFGWCFMPVRSKTFKALECSSLRLEECIFGDSAAADRSVARECPFERGPFLELGVLSFYDFSMWEGEVCESLENWALRSSNFSW